jgi:hypothetical protein
VDVSVSATGSPTLLTSRLKAQSITLLKGSDGRFAGTFTFNLSEQLADEKVTVEARDATNKKITLGIPVPGIESQPTSELGTGGKPARIPVPTNSQILFVLRIIFGILSAIYLGFLVVDAIIIHSHHINRAGVHIAPRMIIFLLVSFINIYGKF